MGKSGSLARASYYYDPAAESPENLRFMRQIDEPCPRWPLFDSRRFAHQLGLNRKHVQRLMRLMGIEAHYPKPRLSQQVPGHLLFPYLLRNLAIARPDQVWSGDLPHPAVQRLSSTWSPSSTGSAATS